MCVCAKRHRLIKPHDRLKCSERLEVLKMIHKKKCFQRNWKQSKAKQKAADVKDERTKKIYILKKDEIASVPKWYVECDRFIRPASHIYIYAFLSCFFFVSFVWYLVSSLSHTHSLARFLLLSMRAQLYQVWFRCKRVYLPSLAACMWLVFREFPGEREHWLGLIRYNIYSDTWIIGQQNQRGL